MKRYFFFPFLFLFCACASDGPRSVSEFSREDAIRLYDGGIAEADWLAQLNVKRNANSVRLADGFIFYKTEELNGIAWVNSIALPADAPETLKQLARSLRRKAEPSKEIYLNRKTIRLDGNVVSEQQLRDEIERLSAFPRSRRPHCRLLIGNSVPADTRSRIVALLKKSGILIESESQEAGGI